MMSILARLKPKFWDYHQDAATGSHAYLFNFRRIWYTAVLLTTGVVLLPLIFTGMTDYKVTQSSVESEVLLRTSRLVSNTRRSIAFFLEERRAALRFIEEDNSCEVLHDPARLATILENLKKGFGGFVDLGMIDATGKQRAYVGPYKLRGIDYSGQEWFKEVKSRGVYISDVFLGFRHVPHLVIAIKHTLPKAGCYVLRASLDTEKFKDLLSGLEMAGMGDAFIINHEGLLQTPSHSHGKVLDKISLPIPEYAPETRVFEWKKADGVPIIIGYRHITDTPFVLMVVKQKPLLMKPWYETRTKLTWFLAVSVSVILLVILGGGTYLVNKIYQADQRRLMILHQVEYASKMASLGRLAAGVAHEINNPLAIINEKAGYIQDLITYKKEYAEDRKLMELVESILSSVERCSTITRRLLSFARHVDVRVKTINLSETIEEVLSFLRKEAEYRSIALSVKVPQDIPPFESDRGRLQEIFLNLFNNAFAAMSDGGHLDITARREDENFVSVTITDDGCGMSEADLKRIFEPFFSTKKESGGTGLGLSITYGLVQEIGGSISVQSEVGKGTSFVVMLPLHMDKKEEEVE
ncbi:MAG: ATP-binding protein [Desulfobacteraceae bacterium]